MDARSLTVVIACGALLLNCGAEESEPPASVSAREATAVEPARTWPDRIVAERNRFLPEGVEYDRTNARFLVGSLREGSVFHLSREGSLTTVVEDPELVSSVGIEVDEERNRLLVANSDASIFTSGGTGQAKLGVFDLSSGKRIAMVDLATTIADATPETVFFANDVTSDDAGMIYITDTRNGSIYRVNEAYEASLLHRFEPSESFSPNGLVYHPSGYLLVAGAESLFKLPIDDPGSASQVSVPVPISGADGAVWMSDGKLAIVANRANQVVALMSSDDWTSAQLAGIAAYDVAASTVAVVGDDLYVVHPHFRDDGVPSVERVEFK